MYKEASILQAHSPMRILTLVVLVVASLGLPAAVRAQVEITNDIQIESTTDIETNNSVSVTTTGDTDDVEVTTETTTVLPTTHPVRDWWERVRYRVLTTFTFNAERKAVHYEAHLEQLHHKYVLCTELGDEVCTATIEERIDNVEERTQEHIARHEELREQHQARFEALREKQAELREARQEKLESRREHMQELREQFRTQQEERRQELQDKRQEMRSPMQERMDGTLQRLDREQRSRPSVEIRRREGMQIERPASPSRPSRERGERLQRDLESGDPQRLFSN